ncbi:MAG: exodeoxyribonuclease VII small subunit [Epsilonproteobacteria bacterium]|nr:exodeoxyribonuclease VII small subunit [Campylobacterota bacterium]
MENKEITFEQKIEKAKKILEKLMQPEITLAESVKAYEEGIKELNEATKMLENAQLKIQEIKQNQ